MWYRCPKASGTIIMSACSIDRPPRTSSSSTLSKMPESLNRSLMTGASFATSAPNRGELMVFCRAFILLMLPRSVLISPLCAMQRNGCASAQDGKVLVL